MPQRSVLVILTLLLSSWTWAQAARTTPSPCSIDSEALQATDIALCLNGTAVSTSTLQLLQALAAQHDASVTLADVARAVIDDHLLADHARASVGEATLFANDDRLGVPRAILWEDQLIASLHGALATQLKAAVRQLPEGRLDSLITRSVQLSAAVLRQQLALHGLQTFQLPPDRLQALTRVVVLKYRLPGQPEQSLSLADLYRRQNVQGRIQLHQGDVAFLEAAAKQRLAGLYVRWWVARRSGLPPRVVAELERHIRNRSATERYLQHLGLHADAHGDNAYLQGQAKAVTEAEIEAYYTAHREEFNIIEKARGRHIRLADEAQAQQVYRELQQGLDFAEAVRRYSLAADKDLAEPGSLGWVINGNGLQPWLQTLTFVLPVGHASAPMRSPHGDGQDSVWEIVLVDKRIEGVQAIDDGARYQAAQAIAKAKTLAAYHATRARLRQQATVRLNATWLGERLF